MMVDTVRGQEAVVDALPQAVGVERVAEVAVRVPVVLAEWRGGHAQLVGEMEVLQDFPPAAFVAGTAAMTLVDDDQVEEIGGIFPEQAETSFIFGDGLVDRKVHLPARADLAVFDFPAGLAEGREGLVLGIVDQDVTVCQVQNLRPPMLAGPVPAAVPELPGDLKPDLGLARARGHCDQNPVVAAEDGLDGSADSDLLVVPQRLAAVLETGREELFGGLGVGDSLAGPQSRPEFSG